MKIVIALLLIASLTANIALWTRRVQSKASAPAASTEVSASAGSMVALPSRTGTTKMEVPTETDEGLDWRTFPTHDLAALSAHLKELGYPPHIIRGIVGYYLDQEFRPRKEALHGSSERPPYWRQNFFSSVNTNQRAQLRALAREQAERLDATTGTTASMHEGITLNFLSQRYGDLPSATLRLVQSIEQDYGELMYEIRSQGQGLLLASDRANLELLAEERRKDLLKVLTSGQYEELELRSSSTAASLRHSLVVMEPNEQEFRTIFRLQQAFDEKYSPMNMRRSDQAFRSERQAAEQALIEAVKTELGPERGAEYEKGRDGNYVHAHTVARQLNLPKETGDRLYALQKNAFEEFSRLSSAAGMNTEQRQAAQREFVKATKTALVAEIGEANLGMYQNGIGGWLHSLEQAANRGPGATSVRTAIPPTLTRP